MRILHTSDWHLGRTLAQESLLDDQAHLLEQVFQAVATGGVDALIIAGDIFDRPNPRREAVALFNDFLRRIYAETPAAIIAIAGNHDAPERVSFNSALQDPRRVLIRGPLSDRASPLVLNDQHGPVAFSALPYSEVFAARESFGELAIASPADVLAAQVGEARQHVPTGARWIIAAHAFVEGGRTTETERPLTQVGGIETVPAGTFDGASYVALGHLHRAQSAGGQHIRYCGSWMGFGFDEAGESKAMTLVDLDAAGAVTFEQLPLIGKRPLRVITGRLEEVLQLGRNEGAATAACLVKAILTDAGALVDAIGQLRAVWPHVLQIERTQRVSLSMSPDSIDQELQRIVSELTPLSNAMPVDEAQRRQKEASDHLAQVVEAWDQARDEHTNAEKEVASTAAALAAALADLPDHLRSIDALEAAIVTAREAAASMNEAHERASTLERTASDTLKTLQAKHRQLEEAHETRAKEAAEHLAAFEAALSSAKFDRAAFDLAKADVDQISAFSARIDDHRQAQSTAADRVSRANVAVLDRERPNLEASRQVLQEAESAVEQLSERLSAESFALVQLEATRDVVIGLTADLDAAQASYSVIGTLAQLTDGNNAQKLRLRDYAIAATFDQVLEAANLRFARMSRNRFTLLRKLDVGDGRGRSGLEIEVYDTHTDQRRDAYTLSGGEGFLASLSLALGLSDVVQAEAGGVKLDAIFIDEGFGHLDDETLDVALETLRDLVGRDRAVGVISHVETVKDQIPLGFDVTRQARGSVVSERAG